MTVLRETLERLAWEVLTRASITRPPIDVDAVAAAAGMRFRMARLDSSVAFGFYCHTPPSHWRDRTPFALISVHQHPLRAPFTKAHELAHHLIDDPQHDWVAPFGLPAPGYTWRDYHEAHEFFAASLLMPRPWVDRFDGGSWRRRDVERFARHFAVTKVAAAVRLEELYGRSRMDIVPEVTPVGELTGLYSQA
jgi:Zn-dependent peptidase ImmA (M78 family)